uniref:Uncharacterized protein n=1 Tax=Oryza meridionalis TaxID=40149 RepID=A0A0E0DMY7_9ORYZ
MRSTVPTPTSSPAAAEAYFFPIRCGRWRGRPIPPPPRTPPLPTPTSSSAATGAYFFPIRRALHLCPTGVKVVPSHRRSRGLPHPPQPETTSSPIAAGARSSPSAAAVAVHRCQRKLLPHDMEWSGFPLEALLLRDSATSTFSSPHMTKHDEPIRLQFLLTAGSCKYGLRIFWTKRASLFTKVKKFDATMCMQVLSLNTISFYDYSESIFSPLSQVNRENEKEWTRKEKKVAAYHRGVTRKD